MENIYYINLEHRKDRKDSIEAQLKLFDLSFNRIDAIYNKNGAIGCGLSHIKSLKKSLEIDSEYSVIIEDDLFIFNHNNFKSFLRDFNFIRDLNEWDIIVLTPRGNTIDSSANMINNSFKRIVNNQTTTGYIVKKYMIPILINNIKEAIEGLLKKGDPNQFAIDQYWKRLQEHYKFYYYNNIFAGQLPGYSDIENRNVDYNERYINQVKY